MNDFFKMLFDEGEQICISENTYSTVVGPIPENVTSLNYFVINPLKTKRADDNVTAYRNILLECDNIPKEQQLELFKEVPFATQVDSAGKSIHTIISLTDAPTTREGYDAIVKMLYRNFEYIDKKVKNPSRFSRTAGAMRGDKEQKLLKLGKRVSQQELIDTLGLKTEEQFVAPKENVYNEIGLLTPFTKVFLEFGAEQGEWNDSLFRAACEMARCNYTQDQIWEAVYNIEGRLDSNDKRTIKSALENEHRRQNAN